MEFRPIWSEENWDLFIDDNDKFVIYDIQKHAEIYITKDHKSEFQQLIQYLSSELWKELVNIADK